MGLVGGRVKPLFSGAALLAAVVGREINALGGELITVGKSIISRE